MRLLLALAAIFATLSLQSITRADDAAPAAPSDSETPLHREMEAMNRVLAKLTRQAKDASKNEASLALVSELQQHTLACKALNPAAAATRPSSEQPKYLADYRQQMIEVFRQELDLEQQFMAGDNAKAAATIKAIRQLEKKGHDDFRPKDAEK